MAGTVRGRHSVRSDILDRTCSQADDDRNETVLGCDRLSQFETPSQIRTPPRTIMTAATGLCGTVANQATSATMIGAIPPMNPRDPSGQPVFVGEVQTLLDRKGGVTIPV
ncbi:hypothetical protein Namu_3694 [Nakamurella multipartita DSM 44233]|uniref:Uncharacterized protein n=1 Tax=Nakamurella multipartita (strain ATCC 700099 / DSM 44233 / CIP 104796 / JCM 9543 / NBRC 105858 / Y-104) TaxID=479431 RepID=C8XFM7_NAKMY|nr:hypothetical protein Namu_3694 [Nakamurella multipartita DSM 44233]